VGFVTMCTSILWERVKQLKVFVRYDGDIVYNYGYNNTILENII
jgi:hypothetical protein